MALRALQTVALIFWLVSPTLAQPAEPPQAEPPTGAPQGLVPPSPLSATEVPYPEGAPVHDEPVVVRVKIVVGADGRVIEVTLVSEPQPGFDQAVLKAAATFEFEPATFEGEPVEVEIDFSQTFLPPAPLEPPPAPEGPATTAELRGVVKEKGTGVPVARATVVARVDGARFQTQTNNRGRFRLALPEGEARVFVVADGYLKFGQTERLADNQALAVGYLLERLRYDPYEIVVQGERSRTEISRTTLRGKEIKQIPGTFGDPFRVVGTLPGVSPVMSLLPFPVVRGSSPGSTGFLIDRSRVPLLFHLMAGPSVIHPEFIEEVHFYPGGFPVTYGGYVGGIVDGETRSARAGERVVDIDLNLVQTGVMVRQPLGGGVTVTAAGRYGYPGLLLSLISDEASLSYWDYQLRLDGGDRDSGWTFFAFGAQDDLESRVDGELRPVLSLGFHRLDFRYHHKSGPLRGRYQLLLGRDETFTADDQDPNADDAGYVPDSFAVWIVEGRADLALEVDPALELRFGLEGVYRHPNEAGALLEDAIGGLPRYYGTISALTEAVWRPLGERGRLVLRPGVRMDWLADSSDSRAALDPRLTARVRLTDIPRAEDGGPGRERDAVWLKTGVGLYHQPPRFAIPLPGLDQLALTNGLLESLQTSVGLEVPLSGGLSVDLQAYYSHMDPIVFDLQVNADATDLQTLGPDALPGTSAEEEVEDAFDPLVSAVGRSYGLELMLRLESRGGPYGWLAYTLSQSERKRDGRWVPFDFDRTHIVNLVVGVPLPRNWEIGTRLQVMSGTPTSTTYGFNAARNAPFVRLDLRIDKRIVHESWMLDFYIDIQNVFLGPEELSPGARFPYVLPTFGVRARL